MCRPVVALSLIIAASILLSGCGVTLSPVKRAPLQISKVEFPLKTSSQVLVFQFESTLANEPLADTVWDNVGGAFADSNESKNIGYTQDYSKLAGAFEGPAHAVFGDVGGVTAAIVAGTRPDYTRIVIPFGRIFEWVFHSCVRHVFPNAIVQPDNANESSQPIPIGSEYVVRLRVVDFQVWEHPLNHLNFEAIIDCGVTEVGKPDKPDFGYDAQYQINNQSIGSVLTTSRGFVRNMNKVSDNFAATLSGHILQTIQEELQQKNGSAAAVPKPIADTPSAPAPPHDTL